MILSLERKLLFLGSLLIIGFCVFVIASFTITRRLIVNGPVYKQIVLGKDLVADVLPPPIYIIEAYLVTHQMLVDRNPAHLRNSKEMMLRLQKEYDVRYNFWKANPPPSPEKELLLEKSYDPAVQFFTLIHEKFIPAVDLGQMDLATVILEKELAPLYNKHRSAVDELVQHATARLANTERSAAGEISSRTMQMSVCAIGSAFLCLGVGQRWVRQITHNLQRVSLQLEAGADSIAAISKQVAISSHSLAAGSSEQAAALVETSASLEQMTERTKSNTGDANHAKDISSETRQAAELGSTNMQQMNLSMAEIQSASGNISKIIKTIDEIAFRTNILALNAAVEAARAGEAGAGFAVVADEVRNLAQRSASAARETSDKIAASIQKSVQGVSISQKVGASLAEIVNKARSVDQLVAQISLASEEQLQGIEHANQAVTQMDKVTRTNATSAEEGAMASDQLAVQADTLQNLVSDLQILVTGIRHTPRVATSSTADQSFVPTNGHSARQGFRPLGKKETRQHSPSLTLQE